jgi:hypothetical protein
VVVEPGETETPVLFDVAFPVANCALVHDVAFVEDHVRLELPPLVIEDGVAVSVTVGAGLEPTVTVADAVPVPPAPVQLIV